LVKVIDQRLVDELGDQAKAAPRKRSHFNLHEQLDNPVQRLLIALDSNSYVTPHYHPQSNKWELMVGLEGVVVVLIFGVNGEVLERYLVGGDGDAKMIEIPAGAWHSVFSMSDSAVILEVKEGPYTPSSPGCFASWAPAEGDQDIALWLRWARQAKVGDSYSG